MIVSEQAATTIVSVLSSTSSWLESGRAARSLQWFWQEADWFLPRRLFWWHVQSTVRRYVSLSVRAFLIRMALSQTRHPTREKECVTVWGIQSLNIRFITHVLEPRPGQVQRIDIGVAVQTSRLFVNIINTVKRFQHKHPRNLMLLLLLFFVYI